MSESKKITSSNDLDRIKEIGLKKLYPDKVKLSVSMASCGLATGAGKVFAALEEGIKQSKSRKYSIKEILHDLCHWNGSSIFDIDNFRSIKFNSQYNFSNCGSDPPIS